MLIVAIILYIVANIVVCLGLKIAFLDNAL